MPVFVEPSVLDRATQRTLPSADAAQRTEAYHAELLHRARYLQPAERALLQMRLIRNLPIRQIAALLKQHPGVISRRIRSLIERLVSPTVAALVQPTLPIDNSLRRMAIDYFLNRQRIGPLAEQYGLSPTVVRKQLTWIRGWVKGRRDGAYAMHVAIRNSREEKG